MNRVWPNSDLGELTTRIQVSKGAAMGALQLELGGIVNKEMPWQKHIEDD